MLPQDEKNDLKPLIAWGQKKASLPLSKIAAAVRGMVEARRTKSPEPAVAPPPASAPLGLPPRGRFVGRETDLDQLRAWILDDAPQPIVVLGPGGIGKSKLTIAALHDPAVAARFADRRSFVRLHEVRDEAGVYGAVAAALGREPGAQPLADVIAALAGEPALLVLDNAESPWEVDPTGAEQAFARLAELPGTSLVVSLRGFELPGTADWRPILVEPLPLDPARSLFLAIAGDRYAADPALPTLLARLDGLPLAIELVAHRARTEPDAATVLRHWESERSAFVRRGQGGRKDLDLAVSIALSLASPRLTDAGRRLFAVLGRLPHGLARADLPAIMPRDGTAAANALAQTGLVLPDPERLRMLAPVREHAAEHTPGEPEATALAAHYAALADTLPYLGASSYDRDAALRARVELPNIEAVLPRRTADAEGSALGWRWIRVGDTRQTLGSIGLAMTAYETARDCFAASATADPASLTWQRASPSAGTGSATCGWPRATCPAPSRPSPTARTSPTARRRRPRQRPVAARPLRQLEQARRRAVGPGRPAGRPPGLHRRHGVTANAAPTPPTQWQSVRHERTASAARKLAEAAAGLPAGTTSSPAQALADAEQARRRAQWQRDPPSGERLATCRRAPSRPSPRKNIADKLAAADPGNASGSAT